MLTRYAEVRIRHADMSKKRANGSNGRVRINPTVTQETARRLATIAGIEHRDMSHQIDALVEAEWRRRQGQKEAA